MASVGMRLLDSGTKYRLRIELERLSDAHWHDSDAWYKSEPRPWVAPYAYFSEVLRRLLMQL